MFTDWQRGLLDECRVAHLGTIAPGGEPHLVPVCFAFFGERFVIAIDEKPKRGGRLARVANIGRDPRVTLLVDRYAEDWERLAWVRIHGRAAVLQIGAEEPGALAALRERYPRYRGMSLESRPLIVISPQRIVSWQWTDG